MKRSATKRLRPALACAILFLVAVPMVADDYGEVVAMLEGGLSEATILGWLEAGDVPLSRPSADELVRLKAAGATEEFLQELLRRSRRPAERETADTPVAGPATDQPRAPPPSDSSVPASPPEQAAEPAPEATVVEPVPGPDRPVDDPSAGRAAVHFRLLYSPRFDEDEEAWDLLVYLDGRPLSHVPAGGDPLGLAGGGPLEFELELPPGEHTVRVLQERHRPRRRGWRHAARAAPPALTFDLAAGMPARVEVAFRQSWADLGDPLTFRFTQSDRVADLVEVGGDPDRWPELCEDAGREPSPGGCLGWSSLWPEGAPPRSEVLEALARFDFRPVPR